MSDDLLAAAPCVSLADFTSADLIAPRLDGLDAATVMRELCAMLQRASCLPDPLAFYQAALHRQFLSSSELNHGVVFIHARVTGVSRLVYALGRTTQPLHWVLQDPQPVRLVFLCAVPATEAAAYLLLAAGLARLIRKPESLKMLLDAGGAKQMQEVLNGIPVRGA